MKNCKHCDEPIPPVKVINVFCNNSCAASYNNVRKPPKHAMRPCLNCSNSIKHYKKYCDNECQKEYEWKQRKAEMEAGERDFNKRYLLEEDGHVCSECDNTEWNGKPIPLEFDHIDGNSENNTRENLRLMCPNCHAQTDTYKGKNKGKGRHSRRKRYHDGLSY